MTKFKIMAVTISTCTACRAANRNFGPLDRTATGPCLMSILLLYMGKQSSKNRAAPKKSLAHGHLPLIDGPDYAFIM